MPISSRLSFAVALSLALLSLGGCASEAPAASDGAADENFTAAAGASADVVTALKKANRASLLPTRTVAWVYRPGAMDAVVLDQPYPGTDRANETQFAQVRDMLKTRGFYIVGKTAPFKDCEFTAKNDYLGKVTAPTFLSKRMVAVNDAIGETVYSDADMTRAKAIEASISYKLVLTKEHVAIYLGKQGGVWKIIAIDDAEYSCDA